MRPVRLDLHGFAGFRDATTVDFTDADYFALVGPTGSGKSTVIDAMTFALYGSAPRWGSVSSIQYALAPTASRCTVRLIFDVAGQRYVVAREVRRSGQQILQKSCLLERYADPAATADPESDEPTEPLAGDPKAVRQQVIELLGLEFDDFCTCVVLPQGDFATFLKASASERQTILLKLLGARVYDAIGKTAGRQATEAGIRIGLLTGQLEELADATEDAEAAARSREAELAALQQTSERAVAELGDLVRARATTKAAADAARDDVDRLRTVSTPTDVSALQDAITAAETAYRAAADRERQLASAAQNADRAVRSGPQRAGLEETQRWHAERTERAERLERVREAAREATDALMAASAAAEAASAATERARDEQQTAALARQAVADLVGDAEQRLATVTTVEPPADAAELGEAQAHAEEERTAARAALEDVERELTLARDARSVLPERSALTALQRAVDDYAVAVATAAEADVAEREAARTVESARATATTRAIQCDDARALWEEARTRSTAADLRPHLRIGDACPVCDQTVAVLPPIIAVPELVSARSAYDGAQSALHDAERELRQATSASVGASARAAAAAERVAALDRELTAALPGRPGAADRDHDADRGDVDRLTAALTAATGREEAADRAVTQARIAVNRADRECARLEQVTRESWAALHVVTGRLASLGAPPVTSTDLAAGWQTFEAWARTLSTELQAVELPRTQIALDEAERNLAETDQRLAGAVRNDRTAGEALTTATVTERELRAEGQRLTARLDQLAAQLAERPSAAEVEQLLAECTRLEAAAAEARDAAHTAAQVRHEAEAERDRLAAARDHARAALRRIRDPLVGLGAPAVDDHDLATAWSMLTTWAARLSTSRADDLAELQTELATTESDLADSVSGLAETISEHAIDLAAHRVRLDPADPELSTRLTALITAVTVEHERARGRVAEIGRRRRSSAGLQTKIAADTETQQVAAELQRLMGSRKFPQWLANAALDTLVADASDSLLRLSNGQFELTHQQGEFFVIDHADADSRRSVRTLSGGETFQASLALALALSEQLSTLAAGGRTTLDSIFLDEGFGTLDPDALEIVAGTLETLAQEDRMVGVITHVAALAERVPVRFEVSRDSRTSTVERVRP